MFDDDSKFYLEQKQYNKVGVDYGVDYGADYGADYDAKVDIILIHAPFCSFVFCKKTAKLLFSLLNIC